MFDTTSDRNLIVTRLASPVTIDEIRAWKASLDEEVARVPDGGAFRLLVDLRDYESGANREAHQEMRAVIPTLLARHGLRTALLDLFPEATVEIGSERGVVCTAVAYVHHNVEKMEMFNEQLTREREQFFTEREAAETWIRRS